MKLQIIHIQKESMSMFLATLALSCSLLLTTSCDGDVFNVNADPFKGQTYTNILNSPISTYLSEEEDFSEYVGILNTCDMFNALNQSSNGTSFTAFAPTNAAMREFYQRRGVSSFQELGNDYLRQFVLFHTVKDSILPEAFVLKDHVTNLSGDNISIEIDSVNAGQATLNDEGQVTQMGLSAYNGKIYVLSKAMTPLVETIYQRLVESGNSTIMVEAINESRWMKDLNTIQDTTYNESHQRIINKRYYTFLNVTDEVFKANGINSFADLKNKLKANDELGLTEDSLLRKYVAYHVMGNSYTTTDLGAVNGSNMTRIWGTSATSQVLTITNDTLATTEEGRLVLNASGTSALFLNSSNILAKNGYVHQLSSWLPVWEPKQTTIVWDLADFTEIKNIVGASNFQPSEPTSTEQNTRVATASCFEFEMGESGTKNKSYSDISYVTCRTNLKDANNNDRMVYNVGYMGSVSMPTPTIVKGKYRVELSIIYLTNHNFMRQQSDGNGGLLRMVFDDDDELTTYVSPYTQVSSPLPGVYTSTIFEEVNFPETASHNFKFVVLDPAASTNGNFSLQFDTITFIPIEE
jgi:uncharacterized surface protein with fasciclin (FAS1) repeats